MHFNALWYGQASVFDRLELVLNSRVALRFVDDALGWLEQVLHLNVVLAWVDVVSPHDAEDLVDEVVLRVGFVRLVPPLEQKSDQTTDHDLVTR